MLHRIETSCAPIMAYVTYRSTLIVSSPDLMTAAQLHATAPPASHFLVNVRTWNDKDIYVTSHELYSVSNHRQFVSLFSSLFRLAAKKTSKLCITGSLWRDPPVTGCFFIITSFIYSSGKLFSTQSPSVLSFRMAGEISYTSNVVQLILPITMINMRRETIALLKNII